MTLSDAEINRISEIVAGQSGVKLDARALRRVIDRVVDQLNAQRGNPEVEGATCEVSSEKSAKTGIDEARQAMLAKPSATGAETAASKNTKPGDPQPSAESSVGGLYEQIEKSDKTRVIIAAFGKDRPGVGAALTAVLAEHNCSIEDISQTLLQDFFSMIMIVNIDGCTVDFATLVERLKATETKLGMKVYVMHEDTFRYMHRI